MKTRLVAIIFALLILVVTLPVMALDIEFPGGESVNIAPFETSGGWGNMSPLSLAGRVLSFVFAGLLVVWIFIIIFAAIKIITDPGSEGLQSGSKRIQRVLVGITIGLLFFVGVSFIGMLAGVGTIFEWSESFRECACSEGVTPCYRYRFQAEASREDGGQIEWYCYDDNATTGPLRNISSKEGAGWYTLVDEPDEEGFETEM